MAAFLATFFAAFFFFTGLLLVLGVPVLVVAWRKGRNKTAHRFLIAAGLIGLISAVISATSDSLVSQCETAGNTGCLDFGSAGLQMLFVVGYIITSWVKAVILSRE